MGMLDSVFGGEGADASRQAARQQIKALREGMGILREQAGIATEAFQPFQQAGTAILPEFQQAATMQGFGQQIADIMGGAQFQPVIQQAQQNVANQLATQGLSRSGVGIQALAQAPVQQAVQLANQLNQRQAGIVGQGFGAAQGVGNIAQNLGQGLAALQGQMGQAQAAGTLGAAQARAGGIQNLLGIAQLAAGASVPMV